MSATVNERPTIICLCGSTRFYREYQRAFYDEEHAGRICLTVPCYKDDRCCKTKGEQDKLNKLHKAKIDMADEIFVINANWMQCRKCGYEGGQCTCGTDHQELEWKPYMGQSTREEIRYALEKGKRVRFLNEAAGATFLQEEGLGERRLNNLLK